MDWVHENQLSEEEQKNLPAGCHGKYVDPLEPKDGTAPAQTDESAPLVLEADHSVVKQGQTASLQGNVKVQMGDKSIEADTLEYDQEKNTGQLKGNIAVRQPGMLIRSEDATINAAENTSKMSGSRFVIHEQHIRGSAKSIEQKQDGVIVLKEGTYTSCEPGSNTWQLEGQELKIDQEEQTGSGKNVTLKISSIPVFYLPYIEFPIGDERKTGLLFPSISSSDDGGLDIALPYYLNLAPNYDATLVPRFISGRGLMLEGEARHLSRFFNSEMDLAFLPNDDGGEDSDADRLIQEGESEATIRPYKGEDRWLASFAQTGGARDGWYSNIDFTKVSDSNYFRDFGTASLSVANTTHLDQSAEVGRYGSNWYWHGLVQNQQVLLRDIDHPYRKLPEFAFVGNYDTYGTRFTLDHDYTYFTHEEDQWLNGTPIIKGQRFATDYRASWSKENAWGYIKPEIGVKSLNYTLETDALRAEADEEIHLVTPQASLDTGIVLEHPGGDLLQTIEPRLFYLYRDYTSHEDLLDITEDGQNLNFDTSARTFTYSQLFRDSRFSGQDRLDDANQLSIGVTSNWSKNNGTPLFSTSIGQTFHFDDRRVGLDSTTNKDNFSEIAGEVQIYLGALSQAYINGLYDTGSDQIARGSAGIHYASKDYKYLFNLAYSYAKDFQESTGKQVQDIDQVDVSWATPLSKQWLLTARYNYDFTNEQELETFVGLEYNDCCYRIRLLARRWLDSNIASLDSLNIDDAKYDQGIFFEIQLKGLGGSGAKVNSILNESIFGYRAREQHLKQKR
ncbi:LPS-assembly protein LptD [Teredinibacter sp. KSP-S5-2]|uniref:LPS-assembly protein LptD n=1 Tax=Teredinibacter sp. KSP-S5-2 TaxID=3034506 RepID=UPI0029343CEC|nr:LPS-assembly protein LptD [Teredinibacter sp. KSP-S5-2]WNO08595.1 LPS-assembly protein LptD [Teredinibacter sp. KSP-S5-2]